MEIFFTDKVGGEHYVPEDNQEQEYHLAPEQNYTEEYLKILKEDYNIIYDGDAGHAFKIIKRESYNPLIRLFTEDDGYLQATDIVFDAYWAKPFMNLLDDTIKEIDKQNLWKSENV